MLLSVLIACAVVLLFVASRLRGGQGPNAPPIVRSGWFPYTPMIQYARHPIQFARECQQKYGNTFTIDNVLFYRTFISGAEATSSFFKAGEDKLNFARAADRFISNFFGREATRPRPLPEENERALKILQSLNTHRERFFTLTVQECEAAFADWAKRGVVDLYGELDRLVTAINITCFVGEEARNQHTAKLKELYDELELVGMTPLTILFPWLPWGGGKRCEQIRQEIATLLLPIIRARRASKEEHEDYLNEFINVPHQSGEEWTEVEVLERLSSTFFAARVNTLLSTMWTLTTFYAYPETLAKTRAIIQAKLQETGEQKLGYASTKSLPFLDNVFKESMRLHTVSSLGIRYVLEPFPIDKYVIPQGNFISPLQSLINQDPQYFPEPEKFLPERFDSPMAAATFTFFGNGIHRCKGEYFAQQVMKTVWSIFTHNYDLEFVSGKPPQPDYENKAGIPYAIGGKVMVRVTKRAAPRK